MKIAIPYENGRVFGHFGRTEVFKIYEIDGGAVVASSLAPTNGSGHGALAGFLRERGVGALICGGIGAGARQALGEAGIALYPGVSGDADTRAAELAAGSLTCDPDATCTQHDHGEGHVCHR